MQAGARPTLPAASAAAAACGLLFGLLDGALAWSATSAELTLLQGLGCLAASAFQYLLLGGVSGLVVGMACALLAPRWLAVDPGARVFGLAFAGFLFVEAWWRTRPFFFYGSPATSPERLVVAALLLVAALVVARLVRERAARVARANSKSLVAAGALVCLCGGAFLLARGGGVGARGRMEAGDQQAPSILLVVVDGLFAVAYYLLNI